MIKKIETIPMLEEISFFENITSIKLNFEVKRIILKFESIYSMRTIEEGNALQTLKMKQFDGKQWIFNIKHSEYINWFNTESYNLHENNIFHFFVVTQEYIIEVLTRYPPKIDTIEHSALYPTPTQYP